MKYLLLIAILALTGCMQAIVEKPDGKKYKVNTFFYKLDMDKFMTDSVLIEKYKGDPGETEFYSPYGVFKHK